MVDKIKLNLANCYGIGKLDAELEFKHKGYAIYAPNGVMKTSFAKTMIALSEGNSPEDQAFPERNTICEIAWNNVDIKKEEIFVVKSYDDKYSPDGVSTLLANEGLKAQYETIHKDIAEAKKILDRKLRSVAGYGEKAKKNLDPILERTLGQQYYDALLSIKPEINTLQEEDFGKANYKIIYDPKVLDFLKEEAVKDSINEFAQKYAELTDKSPILREGFQYHHVNQVHKQLKSNNFFNAGHTISLRDKNHGDKEEFTEESSLLNRIEQEKQRIFSDPDLQQTFNAFNDKLTNKELQNFRDYITQNQYILPELQEMEAFERKLWLQYIYKAKPEYNALIEKYEAGQTELARITEEAQQDRNDWDDVIDDFNQRFLYLPFKLSIENKPDVILKNTAPSVVFNFIDGNDQRLYPSSQKNDLLNILSTGESRALYILNIMFEVHTRWKVRKKTLFIFDDIADSFDYKNKFAIIDYLEHIIKSEDTNFLAIILTHNFDFLRTIESREICQSTQCCMALRNEGVIELTKFWNRSDIRNPFIKWQARLNEPEIQIAYIPFLRNVIEYMHGMDDRNSTCDTDYSTLTKMLHYKDGTKDLKLQDYKDVFKNHFSNCEFPEINLSKDIFGYIKETADACLKKEDGINLEHKIVLSIAIRILAEKFMVEKIQGIDSDYDPAKKQMGNLLQDFKEKFNNLSEDIRLLKRVNLITPANIHLNAFMYEPILDMGFDELKKLYQEIKKRLDLP